MSKKNNFSQDLSNPHGGNSQNKARVYVAPKLASTSSSSSTCISSNSSRQTSPSVPISKRSGNVMKNPQPYPKLYFLKEYILKPNPRTLSVALICFCTSLVYFITHI